MYFHYCVYYIFVLSASLSFFFFFFFNDTATTEIYTLSLHDALPICLFEMEFRSCHPSWSAVAQSQLTATSDRKSTRLNSSHGYISYAVFCLKKKKKKKISHKKEIEKYIQKRDERTHSNQSTIERKRA